MSYSARREAQLHPRVHCNLKLTFELLRNSLHAFPPHHVSSRSKLLLSHWNEETNALHIQNFSYQLLNKWILHTSSVIPTFFILLTKSSVPNWMFYQIHFLSSCTSHHELETFILSVYQILMHLPAKSVPCLPYFYWSEISIERVVVYIKYIT